MNDFNYLEAKDVRAGMKAYFIITYPDGTYDSETGYIIDKVLDGSQLTEFDFLELQEMAEARGDIFQDFTIDDYKGYTICVINDYFHLYDKEILNNGTRSRLIVPESERWKSSDKLKNMNNKTGMFEHLKTFKYFNII